MKSVLAFTPEAWIKLQYLCHIGDTEVGGFAVMADTSELLVTEFILIKQRCTAISVKFEDESIAKYFDDMVDRELKPESFARVWLHTHPGDCAQPSMVDEETFARVFGRCDWALMFILARGGEVYARLRFQAGPGADLLLPVIVRWDLALGNLDQKAWQEEYRRLVVTESLTAWMVETNQDLSVTNAYEDSFVDDVLSFDESDQPVRNQLTMEEL